MRAVILVGGFGTRLRPLTYTIPKQMLPIVEIPMIERKIAHLVSQGIDDIVLSMGYRPDAFQKAYPDNLCAGARLSYVIENEPLGTAGAIAFAATQAGVQGTFLALNGDTLTDLDISALIELHMSSGAEATISLTPVNDPSRFGVVPIDEDGRVEAFIEKPPADQAPTNLINAGTYVLEGSFLDRVAAGRQVSIEREIFPDIVLEGRLYAGHFDRYWLDIGTPEAYLDGNMDLLDQQYAGKAFVSDSADVDESAHVVRSVIGAGASVGAGSAVRDSVVLPGATLGKGATVVRSAIGEYATVGDGARLTNHCVVGGNLRVDDGADLNGAKVSPEPG